MLRLVVVLLGCGIKLRRPTLLRCCMRWPKEPELKELPCENGEVDGMLLLPVRGDCLRRDPVAERGFGYGNVEDDDEAVEGTVVEEEADEGPAAAAAASLLVSRDVLIVGCLEEGMLEDPAEVDALDGKPDW